MVSYLQRNLVLSALLIFAVLNCWFFTQGSYLGLLLPLIVALVYTLFFRLDVLIYLLALLVPLSINFESLPLGFGLILPTEPILIALLIVVGSRLFWIEKSLFLHPISLIILLQLLWMLITTATSTIPVVSFKYFMARCWFVIPFYFLTLKLFQKNLNLKKYLLLYVFSFSVVICYVIYIHKQTGFVNSAVYSMTQPFFKDHTSYGAVLAMLLPFLYFYYKNTKIHFDKVLMAFLLLFFIVAVVLSYTRAAWLSLVGAVIFYVFLKLKVKLKHVLLFSVGLASIFMLFQHQIQNAVIKNSQDASGNFSEHINSIYNIKTDASNVERINRWTSAIEMFKVKPVFGFGPGTYSFEYAPYQSAKYKTIISTNFGDVGNAHSEYLGPLSEMGFIGLLLFVLLVIYVLKVGVKNHWNPHISGTNKWLNLSALLGLVTYFIHGFLNNYLDTDKASALFWVFIAFIVALDYKSKVSNVN